MSIWPRTVVIGLALLVALQVTDSAAQTVPVLGYAAAKNAIVDQLAPLLDSWQVRPRLADATEVI